MTGEAFHWPAPHVRVGLIGHRELSDQQRQRARLGFDKALAACRALDGYRLRIVCGLAAGADRIGVDLALADPQAELLAVLPASVQSFRDASTVADPDEYDRQVEQIQSESRHRLLVLPGRIKRAAVQAADAPNRVARLAAHRYKTSVLLRQCECLVAAMDLSDPGKPGGTRECVEQALALGTPVLVIDLARDGGEEGSNLHLLSRIDQLQPHGLPRAGLTEFGEALRAQLPELDRLHVPVRLGVLRRVYVDARPSSLQRFSRFWRWLEFLCGVEGKAYQAPDPVAPEMDFATIRRRIANDQSQLMVAYRGSFAVAYGLGLLAVLLALGIALLFWWSDGQAKTGMFAMTLLKLVCVSAIAWIIRRAHVEKLSELAVALRYVSERLRIMPTLAQLGSSRLDLLHQTQRMGVPAKVAEDLCRRLPLHEVHGRVNTEDQGKAALEALIKLQGEQQGYNHNSSLKSARLHHALEAAVRFCSLAVIAIILADLLVLLVKLGQAAHCVPAFPGDHWLKPVGLILVLLTALLPAIMATANALLFQTQAEQLAERQRDLARTFAGHLKLTGQLQRDIEQGKVAEPVAAAVLIEAERSAAVLAEEVAEWAVMSKQALKEV